MLHCNLKLVKVTVDASDVLNRRGGAVNVCKMAVTWQSNFCGRNGRISSKVHGLLALSKVTLPRLTHSVVFHDQLAKKNKRSTPKRLLPIASMMCM